MTASLDYSQFARGATVEEELFYLAHPLASDDKYTSRNNLDHVEHMLGLVIRAGLNAIAPYHTICKALDDTVAAERERGMYIDGLVVPRCDGIILVGHKFSTGMKAEAELASQHALVILDCIGLPDELVVKSVENYLALRRRVTR